jgi:hypothetical protein
MVLYLKHHPQNLVVYVLKNEVATLVPGHKIDQAY